MKRIYTAANFADAHLVRDLLQQAGIAVHVVLRHGTNAHHIAEACFKAVARALREAVELDGRMPDTVPSTKGVLEA